MPAGPEGPAGLVGGGDRSRPVLSVELTGYGFVSSSGQKITRRNQRSFSEDSEGFHEYQCVTGMLGSSSAGISEWLTAYVLEPSAVNQPIRILKRGQIKRISEGFDLPGCFGVSAGLKQKVCHDTYDGVTTCAMAQIYRLQMIAPVSADSSHNPSIFINNCRVWPIC